MTSRTIVASFVGCLALGVAAHASAQTPIDSTTRRPTGTATLLALQNADLTSWGASVGVIDSVEIARSHARNLSELLQARIPGVSVWRSGGSAAEGSRVAIRGTRTILLFNEPAIFVDGIRIDGLQDAALLDVGVRPSLLDDLAIEDIARIEVLRGPAASSLVGPGGTNGAILISTKYGAPGSMRWSARGEYGPSFEPTGFPANYHMNGTNPATGLGQPVANCDVIEITAGRCVPTRLNVWNPLEQASPFRMGNRVGASVGLNGGPPSTGFRLGATAQGVRGATSDDDASRLGISGSVVQRAGETLDLRANVAHSRSAAQAPGRGNFAVQSNVIANGLFGTAVDDANHGYRSSPVVGESRQHRSHTRVGLSSDWHAQSWLKLSALLGGEQINMDDDGLFGSTGTSVRNAVTTRADEMTSTVGIAAATSYSVSRLGTDVHGRTAAGYARWGSRLTVKESTGVAGAPLSSFSEARSRWNAGGPWLTQRLSWGDRLDVGMGLRLEQLSMFSVHLSEMLKSADISWRAPAPTFLSTLRFRAAYGEAVSSGMADASATKASLQFAPPVFVAGDRAERTAEIELGVDAEYGRTLSVGLTAFQARSSHVGVPVVPPPSAGGPSLAFLPDGKLRDEGIEVSANMMLIELGRFRWDAVLSLAVLRNRVTSLGGHPPIIGTDNRVEVGSPVSGYWSRSYRYADANHDGMIGLTEVQLDANPQFVGAPNPTQESSFRSRMSFSPQLSLNVVLDYRGGVKLINASEDFRCGTALNCRGGQDPSAPLAEQAAYVAQRLGARHIQDASYTKLRELSLRWELPAQWLRSLASTPTAVSLAALNLATWTGYDGLDPETSETPVTRPVRRDFAKGPLTSQLLLRVDIGERPR